MVPGTTTAPMPATWSLMALSQVRPRCRPKYFGFGPAFSVETGTTKRSPSTLATSPPPHRRATSSRHGAMSGRGRPWCRCEVVCSNGRAGPGSGTDAMASPTGDPGCSPRHQHRAAERASRPCGPASRGGEIVEGQVQACNSTAVGQINRGSIAQQWRQLDQRHRFRNGASRRGVAGPAVFVVTTAPGASVGRRESARRSRRHERPAANRCRPGPGSTSRREPGPGDLPAFTGREPGSRATHRTTPESLAAVAPGRGPRAADTYPCSMGPHHCRVENQRDTRRHTSRPPFVARTSAVPPDTAAPARGQHGHGVVQRRITRTAAQNGARCVPLHHLDRRAASPSPSSPGEVSTDAHAAAAGTGDRRSDGRPSAYRSAVAGGHRFQNPAAAAKVADDSAARQAASGRRRLPFRPRNSRWPSDPRNRSRVIDRADPGVGPWPTTSQCAAVREPA